MTFEQAQLYIKLFILQHYDKNIEDIIPNVLRHGKVSDIVKIDTGDWGIRIDDKLYNVFWARNTHLSAFNKICLVSNEFLQIQVSTSLTTTHLRKNNVN